MAVRKKGLSRISAAQTCKIYESVTAPTTATAAATAATTTVTTATTAAATTTAVSTTATTTTATTWAAAFFWLGFIDGESASAVFLTVESGDTGLRLGITPHLDESETLAAAGFPIGNHFSALNSAMRSEQFLQCRAIDIVAQISNIQLLAHVFS
jgi:hypothetical protein